MKRFEYIIGFIALAAILSQPCWSQSFHTVSKPLADFQQNAGPQVSVFDQTTFYMNGIVEFLWTVKDPAALLDGNIIPRNAKQAAQLFLLKYKDAMGIASINDFQVVSVEPGDNGRSDVIFEQTFKGIPILTTKLVMTVENRLVTYVMGRIVPDASILLIGNSIDSAGLIRKLRDSKILAAESALPLIKVVYFPTPQHIHYSFELIEEVMNGHQEIFLNGESEEMEPLEMITTHYNQ